jgi:TrmH family RNA methyltransferase
VPKRITSRQNEVVARYRAVANGDDPALMLLDGEHLVADAVASRIPLRHVLVSAESAGAGTHAILLERLNRTGVEVAIASAPVMAAASVVRSPSAIVALADRPGPADVFVTRSPLVLIACDIQDPGNLGAMVRVAEAAGASGVIATGRGADPYGWKALRGSMGSALRLPISVCPDIDTAIREARRRQCRIIATVPRGGRSLFDVDFTGAVALLIGGEGRGLPLSAIEGAQQRVTIPMEPPVESLNAAVTAALITYEARRQRTR